MEESQTPAKKPGLLDLLMQGDAEAIATVHMLVKDNSLRQDQLPHVLAATKVAIASSISDTKEKLLAVMVLVKSKISSGQETVVYKELFEKLNTHEKESIENLTTVANAVALFIDNMQIKNENIEEIAQANKDRIAKMGELDALSALTCSKISGEQVAAVKTGLLEKLGAPENEPNESIEILANAAALLIENQRIKNGSIIEIAEAIADGLAKMRAAPEKRKTLKNLRESVLENLPGSACGDLANIYDSVFNLAERPNRSKDSWFNIKIQGGLKRLDNGDPNLNRLVTPIVAQRMRDTLKPLSDGDMNLPFPEPMRKSPRKRATTMEIVSQIGKKIANQSNPVKSPSN